MEQAIAIIVGALLGALAGLLGARFELRKKSDELFLKGLEFLGGGTQKRNLGLSAIELYWNTYPHHRKLCVSLLIGSAIYLLLHSKQGDAAHEIYNLERIMGILLSDQGYYADLLKSYTSLKFALEAWNPNAERGLKLDPNKVKNWQSQLATLMPKQSSE